MYECTLYIVQSAQLFEGLKFVVFFGASLTRKCIILGRIWGGKISSGLNLHIFFPLLNKIQIHMLANAHANKNVAQCTLTLDWRLETNQIRTTIFHLKFLISF